MFSARAQPGPKDSRSVTQGTLAGQCGAPCVAIDLNSKIPSRCSQPHFQAVGVKALLIGHLPHHWLLNNRWYSPPGRKQQAHQGLGLPLCSDFMAFYATIRNPVCSVGAHCARL